MPNTMPLPSGWGTDSVSMIIDGAISNVTAAFVHRRPEIVRLIEINDVFHVLAASELRDESELPLRIFASQSHSSYLSGVFLALSGMPPAAHMVLRGCLEAALYGCHVGRDFRRFQIWGDRDQSDDARRMCRNEFTASNVLRSLKAVHSDTHDVVKKIYDSLIDLGAHPNQLGVLSQIPDGEDLGFVYLTAGTEIPYSLALKTAARTGVCALEVFRYSDPDRFAALDLGSKVDRVKVGL